MSRSLPLLVALVVLVGAPAAAVAQVTVIAVRHAEAGSDGRDPELTATGRARASALADLLGPSGPTHLFASPYRRTRATLAPLAERAGLEVAVRDPRRGDALAAELRALPAGSLAVVAGHSNTVPQLVEELGNRVDGLEEVPGRPGLLALPHDEHGRVFVIVLDGEGSAHVFFELRLPEPLPNPRPKPRRRPARGRY